LETTDVGCNLKQFDGLTWLTLTPLFYNRSTPLTNTKYFNCDPTWVVWANSQLYNLPRLPTGNTDRRIDTEID